MPTLVSDGFSEGDDEAAAAILKKWAGGPISDQLFTVLAGMTPQIIVEVVVLRENNGKLEALTIPRPEGDPVWPGMYHTPGQALRNADYRREDEKPFNGPFERIQQRELGGVEFEEEPVYAGYILNSSERGNAQSNLFWATVPDDAELPEGTRWIPIEDLQNDPTFIQSQRSFIPQVVEDFINSR